MEDQLAALGCWAALSLFTCSLYFQLEERKGHACARVTQVNTFFKRFNTGETQANPQTGSI